LQDGMQVEAVVMHYDTTGTGGRLCSMLPYMLLHRSLRQPFPVAPSEDTDSLAGVCHTASQTCTCFEALHPIVISAPVPLHAVCRDLQTATLGRSMQQDGAKSEAAYVSHRKWAARWAAPSVQQVTFPLVTLLCQHLQLQPCRSY
jgi:hypothetical protein